MSRPIRVAIALVLGLVLASRAAPADTPASACNVSYDCADGQTCATKDGRAFACVAGGAGKLGDACDASLGAPVTCGAGLTCLGNVAPF